jgi:hypothetical protein
MVDVEVRLFVLVVMYSMHRSSGQSPSFDHQADSGCLPWRKPDTGDQEDQDLQTSSAGALVAKTLFRAVPAAHPCICENQDLDSIPTSLPARRPWGPDWEAFVLPGRGHYHDNVVKSSASSQVFDGMMKPKVATCCSRVPRTFCRSANLRSEVGSYVSAF